MATLRVEGSYEGIRASLVPEAAKDVASVIAKKKKRDAVCAAATEEIAKTTAMDWQTCDKSPETRRKIARELTQNFLFDSFSEEQQNDIIDIMKPVETKAGDIVIKQGDKGDFFYVIDHGRFNFIIEDKSGTSKNVGFREDSGFFGELALLYDCPRAATVQAATEGKLWAADRLSFHYILMNTSRQKVVEIENFLATIPLLLSLSLSQRAKIASALEPCTYRDGDYIINQGDEGDVFFLLFSGEVVVTKKKGPFSDPVEVARLKKGSYFGERALLNAETRAASVIAVGDVSCMAMDRKDFTELLGSLQDVLAANNILATLKSVPLLASLTDDERDVVISHFKQKQFKEGEVIFSQGQKGDDFFIIEAGKVSVSLKKDPNDASEEPTELAVLGEGDYFGERALLSAEARGATITALTSTKCGVLSRQIFHQFLGPLKDILDKSTEREQEKQVTLLRRVPLLSNLMEAQFQTVVRFLKSAHYREGDVIIKQGDAGDKFYIIQSGEVVVSCRKAGDASDRELARLGVNDFFGETALLSAAPRDASVIAATSEVQCLTLTRDQFISHMGSLQEIKEKSRARVLENERKLEASGTEKVLREDLEVYRTLGAGSFGRVRLVRHRKTAATYALKSLRKLAVEKLQQCTHIMCEKKCMQDVSHPFILKLEATYRDPAYLYMLLELVQGGELFGLLADLGPFDETWARFYAAQVVLAFEALQAKNYVYRDLKPENILVDAQGYIKIVDFGFAKQITDRTYTLCGTPDYLAPEIVACKGHHRGVDWWALGILIYEMMTGLPPFCSENPMDTYRQIAGFTGDNMKFPANFSPDVQDLILKLLKPNPELRLGCLRNGANDVKNHKWFASIDWEILTSKRMEAPYVPEIKDPMDMSRFTEEYPDSDDEAEPYTGDESWYAEF